MGKKPKRVLAPQVQYARWGAIDPRAVVRLKTPEIVRGKFHIRTITDADMIKRYAGFKIVSVGIESTKEPPMPSGPFMSVTHSSEHYTSFNMVRISHKDGHIVIDMHWHPSHGRLVTVRGFSNVVTTPEEMSIITTALSFDKEEQRRGAPPKVDRAAIISAITKQGEKATQESVAAAAGLASRTLRDWLYFNEGATWRLLKREVLGGELR
jgi:hypothetical protein